MHKKLGNLSTDLFSVDFYYKKTTQTEKEVISGLLHKIYNRPLYKFTQIFFINKPEKMLKRISQTFDKEILEGNSPDIENPSLVRYLDFPHKQNILIFDYETIFPLKEIDYEGLRFPCPNNTEKMLELLYGSNYMKPQGDCYPRHANSTPDPETEKILDEFIADLADKL